MNAVPTLLVGFVLFSAPFTDVSLRGTVVDSVGKPIAGARVGIANAAPRSGPALFCPSCYKDCKKCATTDDQGRFEIVDLDPALKFTVLASSPDARARITGLVDPLAGEIKLSLDPLPANVPPERRINALIVDERDQPVSGALLTAYGAQTTERRWWGRVDDVEPTISGFDGRCSVVLPADYLAVDLQITAPGYAGTLILMLRPGPEPRRIVLPVGTRITGRLINAGRPVPGLRVAVVQLERTMGHHFIKAVGAVTDQEGKFAFDYLPAAQDYAIFTLVGEGAQEFVITTKRFRARGNHEERDLGDLAVMPALEVAGRVDVPAGQSLPPDARIILGRDPAWDLIAMPLGRDGRFMIGGLPPETYEVRVAAKGFEIAAGDLRYQFLSQQSIGIRLRESIDNLRIPLVPSATAK